MTRKTKSNDKFSFLNLVSEFEKHFLLDSFFLCTVGMFTGTACSILTDVNDVVCVNHLVILDCHINLDLIAASPSFVELDTRLHILLPTFWPDLRIPVTLALVREKI